ncbi:MAG: hypothetical protein PHH69_03715 [Candidatus Omnitrophica bacterium]|nr:hypothetical protein [Candidatus Omnitrophota bacterium]MDD5610637.1 hypothetical protein [Candidatus Omnitrophota bacterium]
MSRVKVLGLVIVAIMFCSVVAFAQAPVEQNQTVAGEKAAAKQMDTARMGGMAMQMMGAMQKQMVATNDGGVIILAGNKLLKYDKDLNLIKEAEIKTEANFTMDIGSIQEMMKNMKEKYGKNKTESQATENK